MEEIAGSEAILQAGNRVELIEMTVGFSTTSLIEKIVRSKK